MNKHSFLIQVYGIICSSNNILLAAPPALNLSNIVYLLLSYLPTRRCFTDFTTQPSKQVQVHLVAQNSSYDLSLLLSRVTVMHVARRNQISCNNNNKITLYIYSDLRQPFHTGITGVGYRPVSIKKKPFRTLALESLAFCAAADRTLEHYVGVCPCIHSPCLGFERGRSGAACGIEGRKP